MVLCGPLPTRLCAVFFVGAVAGPRAVCLTAFFAGSFAGFFAGFFVAFFAGRPTSLRALRLAGAPFPKDWGDLLVVDRRFVVGATVRSRWGPYMGVFQAAVLAELDPLADLRHWVGPWSRA